MMQSADRAAGRSTGRTGSLGGTGITDRICLVIPYYEAGEDLVDSLASVRLEPTDLIIVVDAGTPWVDISGNASIVVPALAAPRVPSCDATWAARVRSAQDSIQAPEPQP